MALQLGVLTQDALNDALHGRALHTQDAAQPAAVERQIGEGLRDSASVERDIARGYASRTSACFTASMSAASVPVVSATSRASCSLERRSGPPTLKTALPRSEPSSNAAVADNAALTTSSTSTNVLRER